MKILGIDTATDVLAVALTDKKRLIHECRTNIQKAHAEKLLVAVERMLGDVGFSLNQIDGIAVSIGPGSFTGLRIGLATVKGLAFANSLPIVAVPTLDALVWQMRYVSTQVCPLLKAQGSEAYTALFSFKNGYIEKKTEYQLIDTKDMNHLIKKKTYLMNFGLKDLKEHLTDHLKRYVELIPEEFCLASGYAVAFLGYQKFLNHETENIEALVPFYLKDFKAKKKRGL